MTQRRFARAGSAAIAACLALVGCGGDVEQIAIAPEAEPINSPNPWSSDAVLNQHKAERRVIANGRVIDRPSGETTRGGEVSLMRETDGHFYASPSVDGRSVRMMVDTGASIIALTGRDADAIGVAWNPGDVRPIGRGANGDVYGVPVTLTDVTLGNLRATNVQAVVVPDGLDVTLLGQSFLSQVGEVKISGDRMDLSN